MKIAVLGATGPSGLQLVEQAIQRGFEVTACVRNPQKLPNLNGLQVVKVDITSADELAAAFHGKDAVISCLGTRLGISLWKITFYEDSMRVIVEAMRRAKLTRLITVTSWCTVSQPANPKFIEYFMKPLLIGRTLDSMARMEEFLFNKTADINYTIVRPPELTKEPLAEKKLVVVEGQFAPAGWLIPRANVVRFMLDCLESSQYDHVAVAIGLEA